MYEGEERRINVLRAILEDIAFELSALLEMDFVVEEENNLAVSSGFDAGPCFMIYGGKTGTERNKVLAVSRNILYNARTRRTYVHMGFFRPPDPFIPEYIRQYALAFNIRHISRDDLYQYS